MTFQSSKINSAQVKKDKKLLHTYPVFPEDWWCKLVNCYVSTTGMWTTKEKKLPKTSKGLLPPSDMSDDENFEIISRLNNINHFFVRANVRCWCLYFDLLKVLVLDYSVYSLWLRHRWLWLRLRGGSTYYSGYSAINRLAAQLLLS